MERPFWQYLTIDEIINFAQARLRSRRGRLVATVFVFMVAGAIAIVPLVLRSKPAPAASAPDQSAVSVTWNTTPHPAALRLRLPAERPIVVPDKRIGPPLHRATTTTVAPTTVPATTAPAPAPAPTAPATAPPATAPATAPAPPPTAAPTTGVPPDTGIVVPTG